MARWECSRTGTSLKFMLGTQMSRIGTRLVTLSADLTRNNTKETDSSLQESTITYLMWKMTRAGRNCCPVTTSKYWILSLATTSWRLQRSSAGEKDILKRTYRGSWISWRRTQSINKSNLNRRRRLLILSLQTRRLSAYPTLAISSMNRWTLQD
jgi:hypothetical protein